MNEIRWNPAQQQAIEAKGGALLVSAAAGSGKTAVLVERVIRRITDPEHPIDADRLLVVTFTNAAAQQMKARIRAQLSSLLQEEPDNARLQRQQLLLERARISTIHSFCLDIIKENFSALKLSPESRVADDHELELLRDEAVEEVIEEYYEKAQPAFLELVEILGGGRSDSGLASAVLTLHEFIRSHPYYEDWLAEKLSMYSAETGVGETVWGRIIFEHAESALLHCRELSEHALGLCEDSPELLKAYSPALLADKAELDALLEALRRRAWDPFRARLQGISYARFSPLRGYDGDAQKELIMALRKDYKAIIKKLAERSFAAGEEDFRSDIAELEPKVRCIFELTMDFDRRLSEKKAARRLLDFSDMEQFTLAVLTERAGDGRRIPTAAARELSSHFDEILVDEYQDVNKAQDSIFSVISRGDNLFFVGDVKQSIYRFRQASPELFLEKRASWPPYNGKDFPATIILSSNYRSRREIAGAVNLVFSRLMSTVVGEMEYTADEMLIPAAQYPEAPGAKNELCLVEHGDADAVETEAAAVAEKIRGMVLAGTPVAEGGELRPCRYSDFAIIIRSVRASSEIYARALRERGIGYWSEHGRGFLLLPEISAVMSVLRAVDDPLLDIPLAGAMLSEMFLFSPDELAAIRLYDRKAPLYRAVCLAAQDGDQKSAAFLAALSELRREAASKPTDRVLMRLFDLTLFPEIMRSTENGEFRLANLRLLIKYAVNYEAAGWRGLSGFIRFIDRLEQRGGDLAPAGASGKAGNSVRIMSVHGSKGLEFPIVFFCGTGHNFYFDDRIDRPLLHPEYGFACPRRDPITGLRFATVPQEALRLELRRASLSEELRIVYVAMTRAKERLIITAAAKDASRFLRGLSGSARGGAALDSYFVGSAKNEAEWIFSALLRHPDAAALRREASLDESFVLPDSTDWSFSVLRAEAPAAEAPRPAPAPRPEADSALLELLSRRESWRYPFMQASKIPSKFGVSELTHADSQSARRFSSRPCSPEMSGAARGTALHTFMQFADFSLAEASPEAELSRLVELRYITRQQACSIDPEKIRGFFCSPLYQDIKASPWLRRELRFLRSVPATDFGFDAAPDDLVTVQGVADCVFEKDGSLVILDYKTDFAESPEALVSRYRAQLLLYKKLLGASLGREVSGCVIWSFHFGRALPV